MFLKKKLASLQAKVLTEVWPRVRPGSVMQGMFNLLPAVLLQLHSKENIV